MEHWRNVQRGKEICRRCFGVRADQSLPAKKQIGAQGVVDRQRVLRACRRYDNAKRCLRSLVSDYPADELVTVAHLLLGTLFVKENNLIAARQELLQVTESGGDKELTAEAALQLALVDESSGKQEEAEQLYHSIIDEKKPEISNKTLAQAKLQLARFYFSSGRQWKRLSIFKNSAPTLSNFLRKLLQQSLLALGNGYSSIREFKKLPTHTNVRFFIQQILLSL